MYKDIKTKMFSAYELVSWAIRLGGENMKYILPVCLTVFAPLHILLLFWPADFAEKLSDFEFLLNDPAAGVYFGYAWAMVGLFLIFSALAAAAVAYITVQVVEEKPVKLTELLDASLMRWGKLTYTTLLYFLFLFLFASLIFPMFYFGVIFMLYPCIVAISSKYGFSSLIISRVLMKGKWLKGLFVFLLSLSVVWALQWILTFAVMMIGLPDNIVIQYFVNLFSSCCMAYFYISVCLFYINVHYNFSGKEQLK